MSSSFNNDPRQPLGPYGGAGSVSGGPFPPAEPFSPGRPKETGPVRSSSGWGCLGCALGCLGVLVALGVAAAVGTWFFIQQLPDMARQGIQEVVHKSDLSDENKQAVMQQVDRLVDGYKQGRIDTEQLFEFAEDFAHSPLMDLLIAFGAKVQYIDKSGLSPEEKADAEKLIHRVARGVIEEKISQEQLDVALNHISNEQPNGARQFKEQISDEELRAFLRECQRIADEAQIPDEVPQVDIGNELKKLVDKALGELPDEPQLEAPASAEVMPAEAPPATAPPVAAPPANAPPAEAEPGGKATPSAESK